MATASQPVIETVPSQIRFRLSKSLQVLIGETLSRRKLTTVEKYILELIENDVAPLRLARWRDKFPPPPEPGETKIEVRGRKAVTAARAQKILHLHEQCISPGNIASRLNVSVVTVHRILKENAESTIHVQRSGICSRGIRDAATPRFWER